MLLWRQYLNICINMFTVGAVVLGYPTRRKALVSIMLGIRAFLFALQHNCGFMLSTYSPVLTSSPVDQKWTYYRFSYNWVIGCSDNNPNTYDIGVRSPCVNCHVTLGVSCYYFYIYYPQRCCDSPQLG